LAVCTADDVKLLKSRTGDCAVSVPANWSLTSYGTGQSRDRKISIVVSSPTHGLKSMAQVKQLAPGIYRNDKVVKDSSTEFEMQGSSQAGQPNVYRAIPAGDKVCIAEIVYESGRQTTPGESLKL
jgi:hypothetical protein